MSDQSVLPKNASLLEQGLEKAFRELLYASGNPFPDLLNPNRTSDAMVPYVAQDRGVDDWYSEDSIESKRRIASEIWAVRRRAGTRAGIVQSVNSLGLDAEFVKKDAYKFGLIVKAIEPPAVTDVLGRIAARVEMAKSERSEFDVTIAMESEIGVASGFAVAASKAEAGRASGRSGMSATLYRSTVMRPSEVAYKDGAIGGRSKVYVEFERAVALHPNAILSANSRVFGRSMLRAYRYGAMQFSLAIARFEGVIS